MKDKYTDLKAEYAETISAPSTATGWTMEQTGDVLELVLSAAEKKARLTAAQYRDKVKQARVEATKLLLKNYRQLKWSIEAGTDNTMAMLEDKKFRRLMELEESVENHNLRSTALLTASNKVLWAQLNTALDCFREYCEAAASQQTKRQYRLIFERYLYPREKSVQDIVELLHIERTHFFRGLQEAACTLSVMLFGSHSQEDFLLTMTEDVDHGMKD